MAIPNIKEYKGRVWCVKTSTGAFIARRNGKSFITGNSNFPKSTNLSLLIDKKLGLQGQRGVGGFNVSGKYEQDNRSEKLHIKSATDGSKMESYDDPKSDLVKKYAGYKFSVAPLKQTNETILVFQKPYKSGSCLHDTLAYEEGDETCCCGALNIDGNRVGTEKISGGSQPDFRDVSKMSKEAIRIATLSFGQNPRPAQRIEYEGSVGRYPSQTFIDNGASRVVDNQSNSIEGGCSKILHTCDFEKGEYDIYIYDKKVSPKERNAGCEDLEKKKRIFNGVSKESSKDMKDVEKRFTTSPTPNPHPTLKPISLNRKILSLFKTPDPQTIFYPFAGVFSEVIGGYLAGFTDFSGCEINQEYITIGAARLKHWVEKENLKNAQGGLFD